MGRWTEREVLFLKSRYPNTNTEEISKLLKRSVFAIKVKAAKLNLLKENKVHIGLKINSLTVVGFSRKVKSRVFKMIDCVCDCGNKITTHRQSLLTQSVKSCGCQRRKKAGDATWNYLYRQYKYDAKRRKYGFDLSIEDFKNICSKKCVYCNSEPRDLNHYFNKNGVAYRDDIKTEWSNLSWIKANGIDRADSSLGYSLENCEPCCKTCNVMKMEKSKTDFLKMIEKIYLNIGEKNDNKK